MSLRYPGFRKKCERSEPPGQVYSAEKAETWCQQGLSGTYKKIGESGSKVKFDEEIGLKGVIWGQVEVWFEKVENWWKKLIWRYFLAKVQFGSFGEKAENTDFWIPD